MGRYAKHLIYSYVIDPTKPTFDEIIQDLRTSFLKHYLEQLTPSEYEYIIEILKKEGYIL